MPQFIQKVSPVPSLSRFPRCLGVRYFLELVPVIKSGVEPSLSQCPATRQDCRRTQSRVILSPTTTTSIPVTASESRALRRPTLPGSTLPIMGTAVRAGH